MKRQKKDELIGRTIFEVLYLAGVALLYWVSYRLFDYIPTTRVAPYVLFLIALILLVIGIVAWIFGKRSKANYYLRYTGYSLILGLAGLMALFCITVRSFFFKNLFQIFYAMWMLILVLAVGTILNTIYRVSKG